MSAGGNHDPDVIEGRLVAPSASLRLRPGLAERAAERRKLRMMSFGVAAFLGGLGMIAVAVVMGFDLSGPGAGDGAAGIEDMPAPGPSRQAAAPDPENTSAIAAAVTPITTLQPDVIVPDSGVARAPSPLGLGGKVLARATEPEGRQTAAPATPRLAMAEASAEMVPDAGHMPLTGPGQERRPALILAQSNLVWARVFATAGRTYEPLRHAPADAWAGGACSMRARPDGPAYCALDATVYADPGMLSGTPEMLAVLHEMGHHVQDMLGVALRPLDGLARDWQADCFVGIWSQANTADTALAPGELRLALADAEFGVAGWNRHRLDAFTRGYTATDLMDCAEVDPEIAGR